MRRRFEYRVLMLSITKIAEGENYYGEMVSDTVLDTEGFEAALNEWTEDGWRVVSIEYVRIEECKGHRVCVLERPVKQPTPPTPRPVPQPKTGTIE